MNAKIAMLTLSALTATQAVHANTVNVETHTDSVVMAQAPHACCQNNKKLKAVNETDDYEKFRFGGYGEMVASFKDYGINRFYDRFVVCVRQSYGKNHMTCTHVECWVNEACNVELL